MSKWKVRASVLYILGCVVFIMLLIVVLPFIDLPLTAFHRGTAPAAVHAQATDTPVAITIVAAVLQPAESATAFRPFLDSVTPDLHPDPNFRPILLRSIRR